MNGLAGESTGRRTDIRMGGSRRQLRALTPNQLRGPNAIVVIGRLRARLNTLTAWSTLARYVPPWFHGLSVWRLGGRHARGELRKGCRRMGAPRAIRCTQPTCRCDCFSPGKSFLRTCDTCKHGWVAHGRSEDNVNALIPVTPVIQSTVYC
ncbi:hypothetical protein LSH36_79g06009 [Paralvinella palmiformis]|uniref:Uncharacterized protein n=1 Tax=Paralvinella palmiformis TaxID=53620 RepID=A0AAD9K338_9ANNE|nr:hypothetical protein LSH36_79g06009 [Paralvinella palmiformis]